MWFVFDYWKKFGFYDLVNFLLLFIYIIFVIGFFVMFGVFKYFVVLEKLWKERGVEGLFVYDLVEINGNDVVFSYGEN